MSQLSIQFPAPKAPSSPQLTIWQTEECIALRFSFRVPVFASKGKLKDWTLRHVVLHNVISVEDFAAPTSEAGFNYNANKLAAMFVEGRKAKLIAHLGLNEEQGKLVEFRGLSVARHLAANKIDAADARWV
jgi:hypothetical protein